MLSRRIPFWMARILKKRGKDATYFYRLFPGYRTIYSAEGKPIWIGGFVPPKPGEYPAITWRLFFKELFEKNKKQS